MIMQNNPLEGTGQDFGILKKNGVKSTIDPKEWGQVYY